MKWRSSSVALICLCCFFAVANSSPAAVKKEAIDTKKEKLDEKITPSTSDDHQGIKEEEDDDLLVRAKKSSTVTTFCVEIKPGNEQPAVVVCDPAKTDQQVPISSSSYNPAPQQQQQQQQETTNYQIPHNIPNVIPQYSQDFEPQPSFSYEPLIFIPQQPQILQPQIYPPYYQPQILQPYSQPQILLIRDPSCPSNNPSIYQNPLQTNLYSNNLYSSRPMGKSSQYEMQPSNIWRGGYGPEEDALRSISASNFGGMMPTQGFNNPLDFMHTKRGPTQQHPLANTVTVQQGPAVINGVQNPQGQYQRPVLIQCNPSVTPLSQDAYAAALATGKSNDPAAGMKTFEGSRHSSTQFMQQSPGQAFDQFHTMNHGATHYQQESSQHHGNQYQPNPHNNQNYNYPHHGQHYKMMPGVGGQERAAGEPQGAVKDGKDMSMQQNQQTVNSLVKNIPGQQMGVHIEPNSQSGFIKDQSNHPQGVSGADGRGLITQNQQHQQKMGSGEKMMEGNQKSADGHFYSTPYGQRQNDFMVGDPMQTPNSKDQGFQKQMEFSAQNDQQQLGMSPGASRNSGMDKNQNQKMAGKDTSYSQMLMQRMKSALDQRNMVQPYMLPSEGKQAQSKA